ncbi:phage tail protein (plasmid) [Erwinia tracheiphila]|uniref:tail fiber protein n=1 Tax=Erwinia tracheiphila TaxID=65700 RepID=UPI001F23CCDA|nr:tail fiber protein [Erwinia tracheiphila]UIA94531.1 phage tail protein [Erwinia tracheiphila]
MAATLGQFVADNSGKNVLDDGDVATLLANLQDALKKHANGNLPAASTTVAGITKLSSATNSTDETMAATPKAVKAAYDLANSMSVNTLYPVGIVVWFAQNKNPNTLFPGTTWTYIGENKTIRLGKADGTDIMTTGGADSVTLAVGNLPAHGHTFSVTTGSFDHGTKTSSATDLGTKTSSSFDYGTKTTNTTGAHTHTIDGRNAEGRDTQLSFMSTLNAANPSKATSSAGDHAHTVAIGAHTHTIVMGTHTHTVGIGAHTHSVSGTTANIGSGTAISVANSFVKLMGWYRNA